MFYSSYFSTGTPSGNLLRWTWWHGSLPNWSTKETQNSTYEQKLKLKNIPWEALQRMHFEWTIYQFLSLGFRWHFLLMIYSWHWWTPRKSLWQNHSNCLHCIDVCLMTGASPVFHWVERPHGSSWITIDTKWQEWDFHANSSFEIVSRTLPPVPLSDVLT